MCVFCRTLDKGVAASEEMDITLRAEGVYIVKAGEKSAKVVVNDYWLDNS